MLTRKRIIMTLLIAIAAFLAWVVFVYTLTGWDAKRFTGESLTIFGYSIPIMLGIVTPTLIYGTKPIWDSYPRKDEKKAASETKIEEYEKHTKGLIEKLDTDRRGKKSNAVILDCWTALQVSESWKECLQHLMTGKPELYRMLNEMFEAEQQGKFSENYDE